VINIFALAIKFGLSNQDLKQVLWAYPTTVSDLKYMID
jgi:glutathione reductase (NADPH)